MHRKLLLSLSMIACMTTLHGMDEGSSSSNTTLSTTENSLETLTKEEKDALKKDVLAEVFKTIYTIKEAQRDILDEIINGQKKPKLAWHEKFQRECLCILKDPDFYKTVVAPSIIVYCIATYLGYK